MTRDELVALRAAAWARGDAGARVPRGCRGAARVVAAMWHEIHGAYEWWPVAKMCLNVPQILHRVYSSDR